ncbi:hypothetical protein [Thiosocius teredinicola]|uniref:hypothetical protein n=1 Tax=Thiosocius teredinicola TaxID=1973002 RepID=UPI000990FB74
MRSFLVLLIAFCLFGCDSLNRDQLLVRSGIKAEEAKSLEVSVAEVVTAFAEKKGLINKKAESQVQGTLLYYQSSDEYFPITLGARTVADGVVVDLLHFHPGSGETEAYSQMKRELSETVIGRFGAAVTVMEDGQHYAIEQKSP